MSQFDEKVWTALVALQQACADAGTDLHGVVMRNVSPGLQVNTPIGPISIGLWLGPK